MLIHHKELHILDNSQKEDYGITSHQHEQDKSEYVTKACQMHGHDEKSRSMNNETEVASRHRKIEDTTRHPESCRII